MTAPVALDEPNSNASMPSKQIEEKMTCHSIEPLSSGIVEAENDEERGSVVEVSEVKTPLTQRTQFSDIKLMIPKLDSLTSLSDFNDQKSQLTSKTEVKDQAQVNL